MSNPDLFGLDEPTVWDTERAFQHIKRMGHADTKRTAERRLHELAIVPEELQAENLEDDLGRKPVPAVLNWDMDQARGKRKLVLFAQLLLLPNGIDCLHANDARGARYWIPLSKKNAGKKDIATALQHLQVHIGKGIAVFPHGRLVNLCRQISAPAQISLCLLSYAPTLDLDSIRPSPGPSRASTPHLKHLEAESIHIIREAVAEAENPVMLYSVGKDSSVMLHLARKAFYPARPPFPLLHVDTRWKFQEMYLFRDYMTRESGMDLLVHINPQAIAKDINPFDHGSALHTDITKTEGLKQALDQYKFDVVFGGARRDEEKSRAKERVFSHRAPGHIWEPRGQRPELWGLYNTRIAPGETMRVFPLSNWTELDVWTYIAQEDIPVVPLYFAAQRPVVERDGMLIMVDDSRLPLRPGEVPQERWIRFRTLGCYPLTGAVESRATTLEAIIAELADARTSERQGRAIDHGAGGSMERRKAEGYF